MRYPLGQPIRVDTSITDPSTGDPLDAGALKLTVKKPDGTTQDYTTPAHDGAAGSGTYHQVIPPADTTLVGPYLYWWTATGAGAGVSEPESFDTYDPAAATILTLGEARAQLQIPSANRTVDGLIGDWLAGITATVEKHKHEVIAQRAVTDRLTLCGSRRFRLWSTPVISLTSLASLDGATTWVVSPSAMDVEADTGLVEILSGDRPSGRVKAVYQAGYLAIPENYKQGALLILQQLWETRRGVGNVPAGIVGAEESYDTRSSYDIPRKALEWLGAPKPMLA